MKKVASLLILALCATTMAFGSSASDKKNPTASPEAMLSAEELELEALLEKELEVDVESVINQLAFLNKEMQAVGYDAEGNQVFAKTNLSNVPANAVLLLTEGNTQFYLVTEN